MLVRQFKGRHRWHVAPAECASFTLTSTCSVTIPPGPRTHGGSCLRKQPQKGRGGAAILTALDVDGASGVVLSQQILHHTCVIPRILHSRSADLDSGLFPVGDNTCTAESGHCWREGTSNKWKERGRPRPAPLQGYKFA